MNEKKAMRTKPLSLIVIFALIAGCSPLSWEDFGDGYLTEMCRLASCDGSTFESDYDCNATVEPLPSTCTYDPKRAEACLDYLGAETCASFWTNDFLEGLFNPCDFEEILSLECF